MIGRPAVGGGGGAAAAAAGAARGRRGGGYARCARLARARAQPPQPSHAAS
jgi:hypothetical protein